MYLHNLDTQILLCFYDMRYPCSQAGDRTVLRFVDLEVGFAPARHVNFLSDEPHRTSIH